MTTKKDCRRNAAVFFKMCARRRRQEAVLYAVSLVTVALELLGLWAAGAEPEENGLNLLISLLALDAGFQPS